MDLYCNTCNQKLAIYTEYKVSDKITEIVLKVAPLSYTPNDIYKITEGDEYDIVEYDYLKAYLMHKCSKCDKIHNLNKL